MTYAINHLDTFREVYGFVAGDNVLRFTAMLLKDAVSDLGSGDDFVGQAGSDDFVVTTSSRSASSVKQRIKERFTAEIPAHYNFVDRGRGFIETPRGDGAAKARSTHDAFDRDRNRRTSSRSRTSVRFRRRPLKPGGWICRRLQRADPMIPGANWGLTLFVAGVALALLVWGALGCCTIPPIVAARPICSALCGVRRHR